MPDWILFVGGVLLFVLLLSITVALHEAGHMYVGKKVGLDVPEYSVGFGPKLISWGKKDTRYSIRAIPLGGFVLIEDRRHPEKSFERGTLSRVAPWKRQLVFAAGPAVNIVLGTVLLMVTLLAFPYDKGSNVVDEVQSCSTSHTACGSLEAGIQSGDTVLAINGVETPDLDAIAAAKKGLTSIDVLVLRDGKEILIENVALEPKTSLMGIVVETHDAWRTPAEAFGLVGDTIYHNLVGIVKIPEKVAPVVESIFIGDRPDDSPASVVSMGKTYGDVAVMPEITAIDKLQTYMLYTALFNLGLGIINLLPFLPLDGGRMVVAAMDSIRMRWARLVKKEYIPTRETVYFAMASVSVVAVFGFMGLLILSDFSLIFHGNL